MGPFHKTDPSFMVMSKNPSCFAYEGTLHPLCDCWVCFFTPQSMSLDISRSNFTVIFVIELQRIRKCLGQVLCDICISSHKLYIRLYSDFKETDVYFLTLLES